MAKKNPNDSLMDAAVAAPTERDNKRTGPGYLHQRESHLSQIVDGKIENRSLLWVDPEDCRIWEHHNRRYDLLNERRCEDLIEGIKSQGRQEFPAIVRRTPTRATTNTRSLPARGDTGPLAGCVSTTTLIRSF